MRNRKKIIGLLLIIFLITASSLYTLFYSNTLFNRENSDVFFEKATKLYNDYNYEASTHFFSEALARNPQNYIAKRMLGQAFYFAGHIADAQNEWADMLQHSEDVALNGHLRNLNPIPTPIDPNYQYLKTLTPQLGAHYQYPSFLGQTPNRNIFALSVDALGIGNFMELDSNGYFINTLRNISGKINLPVAGAFSSEELWITDYATDNIRRTKWRKNKTLNSLPFINFMEALGKNGSNPLEFRGPAGICYLNGYFFVADNGNHRIQKIAEDGTFSISFSDINEQKSLQYPFGIACHKDGKIYVAETGANRISIFDEFGGFEESIGEAFLERPKHINFNQNQNYLSIADEKGKVFLYNLETREVKTIEKFMTPDQKEEKLLKPYSAFIDSLNNLYIADYSAKKILQFAPTDFLFNNLEVWIERIDANSFPIIGVWLSVKDPSKNITIGLDEKAFSLFENNVRIYDFETNYLEQFKDQMNVVVVVSRTKLMKNYNEALQRTLGFITSDLKVKDSLQIIEYNEKYSTALHWTNSKYSLKQAIKMSDDSDTMTHIPSLDTNNTGAGLGDALYYAGTTLLKKRGKRAIIWIHEGDISENAFKNQPIPKIQYFLHNNHIPLYSISFENSNITDIAEKKLEIQKIIQNTNGKYYRAYDSSLQNIYKLIRTQEEEVYVLSYKTHIPKQLQHKFIDLNVVVEFQNRVGKEISGFFIP